MTTPATPADYLVAVRRAMERGGFGYGISVLTVVMLVESGRATSIPFLAVNLGLTQKGIRDIVSRRHGHLFEVQWDTTPTRVRLSQDGKDALARVQRWMPANRPPATSRPAITSPDDLAVQLLLAL